MTAAQPPVWTPCLASCRMAVACTSSIMVLLPAAPLVLLSAKKHKCDFYQKLRNHTIQYIPATAGHALHCRSSFVRRQLLTGVAVLKLCSCLLEADALDNVCQNRAGRRCSRNQRMIKQGRVCSHETYINRSHRGMHCLHLLEAIGRQSLRPFK